MFEAAIEGFVGGIFIYALFRLMTGCRQDRPYSYLSGSADLPGEGSRTLRSGPKGWGRYDKDGFTPSG